jgi:hypothetical protein
MAERVEAIEAAERLRAALERIARAADRAPAASQDGMSQAEEKAEALRRRERDIAARLDALIAGLRDALGPQG